MLSRSNARRAIFVSNHVFFLDFSVFFVLTGKVESLSELLWIVGVTDFVLKFATVFFKICVIVLPDRVVQHRKRVSIGSSQILNPDWARK